MPNLMEPSEGRLDGPVHRFALRVYFEDTDAGGIVYHANYLRWFERARSDLLRLLGIDQRAAIERGEGAYAIADLTIRYLRPARLGDAVVIESRALEVGTASWRMKQVALRGDEILAESIPRIGFITPDGRPRRHPASFHAALQTLVNPGNNE